MQSKCQCPTQTHMAAAPRKKSGTVIGMNRLGAETPFIAKGWRKPKSRSIFTNKRWYLTKCVSSVQFCVNVVEVVKENYVRYGGSRSKVTGQYCMDANVRVKVTECVSQAIHPAILLFKKAKVRRRSGNNVRSRFPILQR